MTEPTKCHMSCGKPTPPDSYICPDCIDTARGHLSTIAGLLPHSAGKRAKVGAIDYRTSGVTRSADVPLPFDPRVSKVADPVVNGLLGAYHVVLEGKGWHLALPGRPVGAVAVARWLGEHLGWLATKPEGPEEFAFIERAAGNLERLFDRPPDQLYLGPCDAEHDGTEPCPEHVYVENKRPLPPLAMCRRCGTSHGVNERREWFAGMVVLYQATMRELVKLAPLFLPGGGVSHRTLKEWTRHGLLRSVGERMECNVRGEWRKVPTYRIGDLAQARAAWEDMKVTRQGRRGRMSA